MSKYQAKNGAALFTVGRKIYMNLFELGQLRRAKVWFAEVSILIDDKTYRTGMRSVTVIIGENYRTREEAITACEKWAAKKVTWGENKDDWQHGWCYQMLSRGKAEKARQEAIRAARIAARKATRK